MHNASQVKLGSTGSSSKDISTFDNDPATFLAGLVVRLKSDGALSLLKSDGRMLGVSLGRSLSDTKKTSVVRAGESVPIRAHLKRSTGSINITDYANLVSGTDDSVTVGATEFVAQAGAATPGDATFRAATGNSETATSLATQINAHATASTLVYAVASGSSVLLYSKVEGAGTGHDVAVAYTDNDTNVGITLTGLSGGKLTGGSNTLADIAYIAKGAKAYVNDTTGKLDINMSGHSTVTDAVYISIEMTGIDEDGAETPVALVDMPGGL